MEERKITQSSSAYQKLKAVYDDRFACAARWRAEGVKTVVSLGSDVPDEILIAARMRSIRAFQEMEPIETPVADEYLEGRVLSNKPVLRMFENMVNGRYDALVDHAVISNSDGASYGMYNVLRELRRILPGSRVPPLYFIDLLFTKYHVHMSRNERVVEQFKEAVESWVGFRISEDALRRACAVCNDNRDALRAFDALRWGTPSLVTGTEALVVIGSSLFMEKEAHTALVRELTEEARSWPEAPGKRVFFTGTDQQNTGVYELIERAGGNVVAEDHNWGARHYDRNVPLDLPLTKAIAGRYVLRTSQTSRAFVHERVADIERYVTERQAEAVIFYLSINDDAACWDYPSVKKMLDGHGIPSLLLYSQPNPVADPDALLMKFHSFLNS